MLAAISAAYLTMTSIVVRGANARHPALVDAEPNFQTPTKMPIHPTRALQGSRATAPASPGALLIRVATH